MLSSRILSLVLTSEFSNCRDLSSGQMILYNAEKHDYEEHVGSGVIKAMKYGQQLGSFPKGLSFEVMYLWLWDTQPL